MSDFFVSLHKNLRVMPKSHYRPYNQNQLVLILADKGVLSLNVEYIDGTKIESKSNKYTFVWRKTVEKNKSNLQVVNPFSPQGMYYNKEKDYYVCPMGQHMTPIGIRRGKTENGFPTESVIYGNVNCENCPLRGSCYKAKGNRTEDKVKMDLAFWCIAFNLKKYCKKAT